MDAETIHAAGKSIEYLMAEVAALRLLLIRKNLALSVFATDWMWDGPQDDPENWVWLGIAEYANPIEFAKREMAADKP